MLLGGALMYALPAHASQGSNGITTNGIHVNGNSLNGLSWQATTSQGELPAQRQGESLAFHTLSQRALGKTHPDRMDSKPTLSSLKELANSR